MRSTSSSGWTGGLRGLARAREAGARTRRSDPRASRTGNARWLIGKPTSFPRRGPIGRSSSTRLRSRSFVSVDGKPRQANKPSQPPANRRPAAHADLRLPKISVLCDDVKVRGRRHRPRTQCQVTLLAVLTGRHLTGWRPVPLRAGMADEYLHQSQEEREHRGAHLRPHDERTSEGPRARVFSFHFHLIPLRPPRLTARKV